MAFFEREFIEITREKSPRKMNIVGTLTGSVEREDVRQFIMNSVKKEKRAMIGGVVLIIVAWLLVMIIPIGDLFFVNKYPNPHLGPGGIALTVIFALAAIICTVVFARTTSDSKEFISKADPDSPEQIIANAPSAVIWKQKKQWEMCYYHDLVPLESAVKGQPEFIGSYPLRLDQNEMYFRQMEEKQLVEYASELMKARTVSNGSLTVYLDIDKLDSGAYGLAAGQALGRALPAAELEGIAVFSGDSAATLNGSANEYAVAFSGDGAKLDWVEALLQEDKTIAGLLSGSGIRRGETEEPLVADGTVQNGELTAPAGHSLSFCAAGFNKAWKE